MALPRPERPVSPYALAFLDREGKKRTMPNTKSREKGLLEEIQVLEAKVAEMERARAVGLEIEETLRVNQEEEHLFGQKLVQLVEINNELSLCKTIDDLCRHAVELARTRLGFERVGIWFRTEKPDMVTGSFGVDQHGHITDERGSTAKVQPQDPDGRVLLTREPLVLEGDAPIMDGDGNVVGRGQQAFAAIWDGDKVIGHISMDNQLSGNPIETHQTELLRLFASAIGYLYTRKRIEAERERLIDELRDALAHIKTLRGLIPICCECKKIRDDKGYWNQLEEYIQEHSDAEFSHGICPGCAKKLYPELYDKAKRDRKEWDSKIENKSNLDPDGEKPQEHPTIPDAQDEPDD